MATNTYVYDLSLLLNIITYSTFNNIADKPGVINHDFFLVDVVALKRTVWLSGNRHLFRGRVLRHSLGPLAHCVLSKLAGEEKSDGSLYLAAAYGRLLVVLRKTRCFGGNSFEDVIDETVHDRHGTT